MFAGRPPPTAEIVGKQAPGSAGARHPAQGIEHRAQVVPALRRLLGHQGQIGRGEGPFLIGNVGRIRLARRHLRNKPHRLKIHNTL